MIISASLLCLLGTKRSDLTMATLYQVIKAIRVTMLALDYSFDRTEPSLMPLSNIRSPFARF
jgi:hypothetical protein